ncbi:MAG: response regulator [Treponema sp.]|jgi:signal transduction histidine kinase/ActR/RegA family two-component response regulator|nr:response regulator [Treponema sp.]
MKRKWIEFIILFLSIAVIAVLLGRIYEKTDLVDSNSYLIGNNHDIRIRSGESLTLILVGAYFFLGVYYLFVFLINRKELYKIYYCLFSTLLGFYFLLRTSVSVQFIPDSAAFRLEACIHYMLFPLLAAFAEALNFRKVNLQTKICFMVFLLLAMGQALFFFRFGEDIRKIWRILIIAEILYVTGYDFIYVFVCRMRGFIKGAEKGKRITAGTAFVHTIINTPAGNMLIGMILLSISGIFDIVDSSFFHLDLFLIRYGYFVFTIGAALVMARESGELYRLLGQANMNLEAQVAERTRELEVQTNLAQAASRAKSEFLARMSHEIRTPLNAIIGLAEVELQKDPSGETGEHLDEMYSSGNALLSIINELLDISRIESGHFDLVPLEYSTAVLFRDCIRLNMVRIGSKPIEFKTAIEADLPVKLCGDELRIKQILNNLLSNAIKYTEMGTVTLRAASAVCDDPEYCEMRIEVEDTGKGIRKEDLENLFSEYRRLDEKTNHGIEGTGLGLSIAKHLVELMGGSIEVKSEYGKGSVFSARFHQKIIDPAPLGKETVEKLALPEGWSEGRHNIMNIDHFQIPDKSVLVVDDVATNLKVAQGLLKPYGMHVSIAKSGQQAIKILKESPMHFDLIFMDHMMPVMDGIETVRFIRDNIDSDYARNVPIIALTANAVNGTDKLFMDSGFQDFLSKPINVKKLDYILRRWLLKEPDEVNFRAS